MQNSVLTSSTALSRLILRRCNFADKEFLNIKTTPDSSSETFNQKLLAINFNYFPLTQNLLNNNKTLFPITRYYGNPMRVVGSIPYI